GMKTAFDEPFGTADFSGMAIRRPDDYLAIKDVFHKTFIVVDEQGTEAAAATAVVTLSNGGSSPSPGPIHVNVDRPFVFAIQHRASGACLFLGQVVDPRP
ncbi:MAG: proteinase inhibitor serpin, partial [Verrucomicrobiales bacterium]|nr:proteinase inhibitor serpin [Verrucomicrobiales bacterium]